MKGMIIGVAAVLLLLSGSGEARAQEGTEVEVGVKAWWNDWERKGPGFATVTSDNTWLIGPAVTAKFANQFFVDASYLFSTSDYKFSAVSKFDRQDLDLAIGYLIIPEFGVQAGYRNIWFEEAGTGFEEELYGPFIGILGSVPVYEVFSFYARVNYQITRFKEESAFGTFREDSPGWIAEIGGKFDFTYTFSGTLAYKYETNKGDDTDVRDTFSGLMLGAIFRYY